MGWHQEIVDCTVDELVDRNSGGLLASHLRKACSDYLRAIEDLRSYQHAVRAQHDAGQKIIAELNRLHRQGRKTAKIAELVKAAQHPSNESNRS